MKFTRARLSEMIAEAVRDRLKELRDHTASDEEDEKTGGDKPAKPSTMDANDAPSAPGKAKTKGPDKTADASPPDQNLSNDGSSPDPNDGGESGEDSGDSDNNDESDSIDQSGEAGEEPTGAVNNDIAGKSVQSISIEPKSKVLPGAKEIVLTFNDTTDALRLLVTPTGAVKFFWRHQLHDVP